MMLLAGDVYFLYEVDQVLHLSCLLPQNFIVLVAYSIDRNIQIVLLPLLTIPTPRSRPGIILRPHVNRLIQLLPSPVSLHILDLLVLFLEFLELLPHQL